MINNILEIGALGCVVFTGFLLFMAYSGIASAMRDEEGKFIKQHSQTPIEMRVMNNPNFYNEKVELWATLEEKIEIFWRLKFK